MTDQREGDPDDRVQRRDEDDWRTARRDEIDPYPPRRRGRFRDDYDDYDEDHGPSAAREKVKGPGLAMIIVGSVGVLLSLVLAGFGVAMPFLMVGPGGGPQGPEAIIFPIVYGGMGLASLAGSIVVIVGGNRMRQCRSWGLALTAAILCMGAVLLYGLCGAIAMGLGIWALVVLSNTQVKEEFDRVSRGGTRETEDW